MKKDTDKVYRIDMTVLDDNGFLSPYSPVASPVIASETAEFLENSAENYISKQKMQLNIRSDCIDDAEKVTYDKSIRNYFYLKLTAAKRNLRRNLIISIIFTIIGIAGLALMFVLDHLGVKAIWVEVADIFAWVFLWEAVDQFFIERRKILLDCRKYKAFAEMEINYSDLNG